MEKTLPTVELFRAGQSPWLDYLSRDLIEKGILRAWIDQKGLLGVTSNPSIFQKAISSGSGYDRDIRKFLASGKSTLEIYDALTLQDIRDTCDLFLPVYKKTGGEHGFVSLEVLPCLAHDREATLREARRLFAAVSRPNVMIKVPATPEGVAAVRELISEGININITLMFSLKHYGDVAQAYLEGLEHYRKKGGDLRHVHSVASVFVSRIDSLLDKQLSGLENLKGKAAVANSKLIYQEFKSLFSGERFLKLKKQGARVQKVLWGSTSTKNPAYPDLIYVENLVGPDTVNTMPEPTLEALLDHGQVRPGTLEQGLGSSREILRELEKLGWDMIEVGETLQREGVKAFSDSFDLLMKTLEMARETRRSQKTKPAFITFQANLGSKKLEAAFTAKQKELEKQEFYRRFLAADPSVWQKDPARQKQIKDRLGWLRAPEWALGKLYQLDRFSQEIRREKIRDVVLLGMGGSSFAPEVMTRICGKAPHAPRFHLLDTTDPTHTLAVQRAVKLKQTLFIVSSKSGGTLETLSQCRYFYERVRKAVGKKGRAGRQFIAITDESSALEKLARERGFRNIYLNPADIGGRFSALSYFGLLPAALSGVDSRAIATRARSFLSHLQEGDFSGNAAFYIGVLLGVCYASGRDKIRFLFSPKLEPFAGWIEQMIAESLGKEGKGILPLISPSFSSYRDDDIIITICLKEEKPGWLHQISQMKGKPVVHMVWPDKASLGEAFFAWEVATTVCGALMGVNPFDEPNVRESKDYTLSMLGRGKKLVPPASDFRAAKDYQKFFSAVPQGGYLALLAYVEKTPFTEAAFARLQAKLESQLRIPVIVGFGPRYLHSIGQLYKGGPKKGIFLEFLKRETRDAKVPGEKYSFGQLKLAQALGDCEALRKRGLKVSVVNLGKDVKAGLRRFEKEAFPA